MYVFIHSLLLLRISLAFCKAYESELDPQLDHGALHVPFRSKS